MSYDCAIILAHELVKKNGFFTLSEMSKQRVEEGINLLKSKKVNFLVMSGGREDLYGGLRLSDIMKKYSIEKGVFESQIIEEPLSKDTIGQLIFVKQAVVVPRRFKRLIIITHDFHLKRVKQQANFVFGRGYNIDYLSIPDNLDCAIKEEESLIEFKKTFEGISPEDDNLILSRLLERHKYYNKDPYFFINGLKRMIANCHN
jgi:vancomycin permeability regulator SanA